MLFALYSVLITRIVYLPEQTPPPTQPPLPSRSQTGGVIRETSNTLLAAQSYSPPLVLCLRLIILDDERVDKFQFSVISRVASVPVSESGERGRRSVFPPLYL